MNHRYSLIATLVGTALLLSACGGANSVSQEVVDKAVAEALAAQATSATQANPKLAGNAKLTIDQPKSAEHASTSLEESSAMLVEDTVDFKMPNFVGMVLQDAQDEVQTYGIFFSTSHDVKTSRSQFFDSNWRVCNQTPKAGTRIKGEAVDFEGKFDFGTVKLSENCD